MPVVMKVGGLYIDSGGIVYKAIEKKNMNIRKQWICEAIGMEAPVEGETGCVGNRFDYADDGSYSIPPNDKYGFVREIEP